ncbi:unnamed protein product [Prunus brigantina]
MIKNCFLSVSGTHASSHTLFFVALLFLFLLVSCLSCPSLSFFLLRRAFKEGMFACVCLYTFSHQEVKPSHRRWTHQILHHVKELCLKNNRHAAHARLP